MTSFSLAGVDPTARMAPTAIIGDLPGRWSAAARSNPRATRWSGRAYRSATSARSARKHLALAAMRGKMSR